MAICVERGFEMIVGAAGRAQGGGAYVPLDPAYPAERLRFMLEDSAPVALLTQSHLRDTVCRSWLPACRCSTRRDPLAWDRLPETNPDPQRVGLTSDHLAYVIYTSGSTGKPKGVMVEHQRTVQLVCCRRCGLFASDRR